MTTMMVDPPSKTSMGVGFESNRGRMGDAQAWRKTIGTRPVSARLALLPEAERRWDRMGVSALGQIAVLGFLLLIPMAFPEQMKTALKYEITGIMQPVTMVPVAPPPPPPPKIKPKAVQPKPEVPEPVKLNPKQPHVFMTAKAIQPEMKKVEVKPVELNPQFDEKVEVETKQPKRPKDEVKVGNLSSGSAAPATVVAPLNKVQTGGFGDPNGIPGKGDANHATNVNRLGSPALPGGPGYGNGTGGDKGIRGTVASTGFGNGIANPPPSTKKGTGTVHEGGFANESVVTEAPKKKVASSENPTSPVDILEKPHPVYTAEGRSLKIEGDVVLDMVFLASGSIQVNRVISGLGHGLDDAAVRAAQLIKFKPAKRDGQPVDFPARVRIEFRLAY
jgi:TonB family protein